MTRKSCWRFVKFVPSTHTLADRSTARFPNPTVAVTNVNLNGGGTVTTGLCFGLGEGMFYVNDDADGRSPFDNATGDK